MHRQLADGFLSPATGAKGTKLDPLVGMSDASNWNSTSFCKALVKLNLLSSQGCRTCKAQGLSILTMLNRGRVGDIHKLMCTAF